MSQGVPSGLEGQIDSPNSLELWWENNKRLLIGLGIAALLAVAVNYAVQYFNRQSVNKTWSGVLEASGLDKVYTDLEVVATPDNNGVLQEWISRMTRLTGGLQADLEAADAAEIDKKLEEVRGDTVLEPLMLWIAANRARALEDFPAAKAHLAKLSSDHPKHFLNLESEYPPQYRPEIEKDDDEEEPKKPSRRPPELEPAKSGSPVGLLIERMDAEVAFRAAHPDYYEPPAPDSDKVAVFRFKTEGGEDFDGVVKIRFYASRAPKHYEAIQAAVGSNFFDRIAIHNVEREPENKPANQMVPSNSQFQFGLPVTKDEADQSKWNARESGDIDESHLVEYEDTGVSHFPGMLAAEPAKDGSQIERLSINAADMGATFDGRRVVFGKVIEGMDLVERIVNDIGFGSETAAAAGRGVPDDRVRIESVTLEDA